MEWNVACRAWAKSQGFRLNQNGLYKVLKNGKLRLVPAGSERDIFTLMGLHYVEPSARVDGKTVLPKNKIEIGVT
jgi:DNA polymerase/3'-5' exonuclease PolX